MDTATAAASEDNRAMRNRLFFFMFFSCSVPVGAGRGGDFTRAGIAVTGG
jgi:hypothetical protein